MDPAAPFLDQARNAILACDYDQAVAACREALVFHPKHVEATTLLAEAYREQGRYAMAEDLLRRVLSADPENVLAHWALGLLLRDVDRPEEAVVSLAIARELAPTNAELMSDLLALANDTRAAVRPTRSLLGRYYAGEGLYGRAAEEFRAVLTDSPRRLDVWAALAEVLWRSGEADEAARVCEAILAEAPHCLKALVILANVRRLEREPAEADALLALARELDPAGATIAKLC
ncbi:MAG: tetratricopeptide repeat protein [Chloroflexota bacterium]